MKNSIIFIFLILSSTVEASTCSNKGKLTQEEYNETALIFNASIENVKYDSIKRKRYFSMRIVNVFKGDLDTGLFIVETYGQLSAYYFEKGDKMLLFIDYLNAKPFVSMCSRQYYLEEFSNIPPLKELQDILNKSDGYLEEFYDSDTLQSRGELIYHLPNGKWEYFNSDGELKNEGEYLNGVKIGIWKEYYNGSWHHQNYENGLRNGIHIEYYENGIIKETGLFVNDIKTGIWTTFYKKGLTKEQIDWTSGYIYFWNTWDPNGDIMVKMGNGTHKHYDDDGNPERYSESEIVNGNYK